MTEKSRTRPGIYGLLGNGIGYSLSPAIHNHVFSTYGIDAIYGLFDVAPDQLTTTMGLLLGRLAGFNVTVPYKESVVHFLKDLSDEARLTGNVNLVMDMKGYNTDYQALQSLMEGMLPDLEGGECLIFGAGGSARTAAFLLGKAGMRIRIVNRTLDRARILETDLHNAGITAESSAPVPDMADEIYSSDCVVSSISDPGFHFPSLECRVAIDFNYGARGRQFRRKLPQDARVISGEEILMRQAVLSQVVWNGIEPDEQEIAGVMDVE